MQNPQQQLSVLVIDDNPYNRSAIVRVIPMLVSNAVIDEAGDGRMAVDLVYQFIQKQGKNYDVIFMDFEMPNLNGQEATLAIRKLEQSLSQKSYIITWSSAKKEPMPETDSIMPKPLDTEKLEEIFLERGFISKQ